MRSSSRWAGGIHDHEAPAGRPLQRELRLASGEASKPLTHRLTRRRGDPAAPNLASRQLDRLESDLPAVHIQSAYDLHRDLLELHGLERLACLPRLSRGGPTTCHLYGAPWLQPAASGGKSRSRENGGITPNRLPSVATGCRGHNMVRNAMKKGLPRSDAPRVLGRRREARCIVVRRFGSQSQASRLPLARWRG